MEFKYIADIPFVYGDWFKISNDNPFYSVTMDSRLKVKDGNGAISPITFEELRQLLLNSTTTMGNQINHAEVFASLLDTDVETLAKTGELPDFTKTASTSNGYSAYRVVNNTIPLGTSIPPKFTLLDRASVWSSRDILPLEGIEQVAVDNALNHLGNKMITAQKKFILCKSHQIPTCYGQSFKSNQLDVHQYIILNFHQLQGIASGSVTAQFICQVLTHEYAHYIFDHGIKLSQKERFKKLFAGRGVHKDQFNHPGYEYPWYKEAWAILCEYMVHGKSARGLSTVEGWEIAEQYFDNNFIKNGHPTGDSLEHLIKV
jgi:hypothetical protein